MRTIIVKFEFSDESLEGYEDTVDELIIEDHLRGCMFDNIGHEIISEPKVSADYTCLCTVPHDCPFADVEPGKCRYARIRKD